MGARSIRNRLGAHLWVVGTVGTAALVFAITFIAVSAATGSAEPVIPESRAVAVAPEAPPPATPTAAQPAVRPLDPEVTAPAPPGNAAADQLPSRAVKTPAAAQPPEPAQPPFELPAAQPPEPAQPRFELPAAGPDGEAAAADSQPLPAFNEDELVLGGAGEAGAILAGPGIVRSSGADRQTPWEFLLPSAKIRANIVRIGLTRSNALGAPDNPDVIGWWESGPAPGEAGNVLLDGHRDFTDTDGNVGTGVCWLLADTLTGDFAIIRDNAAELNYVYTVIETTSVVWDAPEGLVYLRPRTEPILTLITCEGSFDEATLNYSNRRIVVAELTDVIPFPTN